MSSTSLIRILAIFFAVLLDGCNSLISARSVFGVVRPTLCSKKQSARNMMEIWWDGRSMSHGDVLHQMSVAGEAPDVLLLDDHNSIPQKEKLPPILIQDGNQLKDGADKIVGVVIHLIEDDPSGQEQALAVIGSVEWILVLASSSSWQMIPAENLIAAAQSTGTKLVFGVDKAPDVGGLARALELGVDALCVNAITATDELWKAVFHARTERNAAAADESITTTSTTPQIVTGSCLRRDTEGAVLADRVCVDLVQSLLPEEGCWVGSSAKIMALVLSEAAASQFVPTRPFRVNAGPVHSYILLADETTKYLCELKPADNILVYNSKTGSSRAVAVGRLKEEVRPCVLVELQTTVTRNDDDRSQKGQVFLQQAETVRLGQEKGEFLRVTELEARPKGEDSGASQLLLRVMGTGTHVGKAYTGKVEER